VQVACTAALIHNYLAGCSGTACSAALLYRPWLGLTPEMLAVRHSPPFTSAARSGHETRVCNLALRPKPGLSSACTAAACSRSKGIPTTRATDSQPSSRSAVQASSSSFYANQRHSTQHRQIITCSSSWRLADSDGVGEYISTLTSKVVLWLETHALGQQLFPVF
jgi:hypothetical protein